MITPYQWILALSVGAGCVGNAVGCDRVEYAEARTWSTPRLEQAYCDTLKEQVGGLMMELNKVAPQDQREAALCRDQAALYKRLLEERGKDDLTGICKSK